MKPKKLLFLSLASSLLASPQLFGQATWVGAGTTETPALWSATANWTIGSVVPTNGANISLTFLNSASNSWSTNDLTGLTVSGITVPANDGAPVPVNIKDNIIGGNAITLTGNLSVSTGNWQTINLPIALSGNRTFAINSGRLFLNGDLSDGPSTGAITKTGGAWLFLNGNNSFTGNGGNSITFSGGGSGRVVLTNTAALPAGSLVRFSGGGSGELELQTDSSVNSINFGSGTGNGGTIIANRATSGTSVTHTLGSLDLSSVTMTVNKGANVTGNAGVSFTEVKMSGGNNNNPVTLAGNADLTVGSASINTNAQLKRLQLDGTSANNQFTGAITDGINGSRLNLIKANSSIWKLSGNNVYTGTTDVNGGTLILDQAALCDAAQVSIATGAVLNLNHSATDVVDSLKLNGVDQLNGIYDATTPGGFITGTGKIKVAKTSVHIGADASLWSNAAAWTANGLAAPASSGTADLTFMSQSNRSSTNDLTGLTASSIYFPIGGRDNTLNGAEVLTLAGDLTVATGNWQTINMPLAISGNRNFVISTGRLILNGVVSDGPSSGAITKSGGGALYLKNTNTLSGSGGNTLVFSGAGAGNVVLTNPAALGTVGTVRFSAGGSGVLEIQTDTSVNTYDIASGSGNGGTIIANRATPDSSVTHDFGALDLSSVTMTIVKGGNVYDNAAVSFTELKMNGGNDNNPVTITGDADITIGSASITSSGISKRLQLGGTSGFNVVTGVISDTTNATAGAKVNLIKAGSSTWHLQGDNTYTGDTTVSGGTLKLDYPCLDNDSTLSIDGTLELNHTGTDVVAALYLGGNLQLPGIYDESNSDGYIIGHGKIEVPASSAFSSWAQQNITTIDPLADATPGGDPDGDGENNLAEFAFRGNPLNGADQGLVRSFTADGSDPDTNKELILTIAMRKANPAAFSGSPLQLASDGVTYTVQGSVDLSAFTAAVTEISPPITTGLPDLSGDPSYGYRSFSLDASNGLTGKGFLRVVVED